MLETLIQSSAAKPNRARSALVRGELCERGELVFYFRDNQTTS